MKTLTSLTTALIAALLILSPALAFAAGTISVTTNSGTYTGNATIAISGTITPPGAGLSVAITVSGPAGQVYAANAVTDPVSGAFSTFFVANGIPASWPSGTYTVTASLAALGYSNGVTTFTYVQSGGTGGTGASALQLWATASTPINAGGSASVEALVEWNNGTFAKGVTFTDSKIITPDGSAAALSVASTAVSGQQGAYWWSIPTTSSQTGLWVVVLVASAQGFTVLTQTSFTVGDFATGTQVSGLASTLSTLSTTMTADFGSLTSAVAGISSSLGTLTGTVGTINTNLNSLTTTVNTIKSNLDSLTTTVNSINSAVGQLQTNVGTLQTNVGNALTAANAAKASADTAATAANSAHDSVGNVSTYVLVAVVIAAIILVLELAILVRKLS
jgi:methyl-accepting chemotaxis protein